MALPRSIPLIPEWRIRVTNFGLGYILLTLLVAIAATNTGNNGLYLVLALQLSGMIVSGVVSRRNLRMTECSVEADGELFAGQYGYLHVTVRNRSRRLTAQGLWFLHEALPGPLWIEPLKPGESRSLVVDAVFPRRGVYVSGDAGMMSRFPLGLFRKYNAAKFPREIVVYPDPARSDFVPVEERTFEAGGVRIRRRGAGAEIRTLRDFAAGDDIRNLHWKQSARMQKWIVREREAEQSRSIVFLLENACDRPDDPAQSARIEARISKAAGEALALLARGGVAGLSARGLWVAPASGLLQRDRLLDALARLPLYAWKDAPPLPVARPGEIYREVAA